MSEGNARSWRLTRVLVSIALASTLVGTQVAFAETGSPTSEASFSLDEGDLTELLHSGGSEGDGFGFPVAVSGDTAVIGAVGDDEAGPNVGAAYVFVRVGGTWVQQAKLLPAVPTEAFGCSVAVSGDTTIIGARFSFATHSGAAYVFARSGTDWMQQAALAPGGPDFFGEFGCAVALDGDVAVVGDARADGLTARSGAAYVFTRSGTEWTQQARLAAADGASQDEFGISISLSGESVLIGANGDADQGINTGSAYVFAHSGGAWSQQSKLVASDAAEHEDFGHAVALYGDSAVVGATGNQMAGEAPGSAYVFSRSGVTWTEQAKLTSDDADEEAFGSAVAVGDGMVIVGEPYDGDLGTNTGSAHVFGYEGGTWVRKAKLTRPGAIADEHFGYGVAMSGATLLVTGIDHAFAIDAGEPPIVRAEETDARILWTGAWASSAAANRSAGAWRCTKTALSSADIAFSGTEVRWIATKAPGYGKALVSLDGGTAEEVDLYASGYVNQQVVWAKTGLTAGPHTVRVLCTGDKRAESSGAYIGIDAIDVAGNPMQAVSPVVRTEETDPRILFQGVWATSAVAARSAGAWRCTKTTGAAANIAFSGTEVRWIATKAPGYGIAYVSLDGGTPESVDLYATDYSHQQIVWAKAGLAAGPHTVRIVCTGTGRAQSLGTYVGIDAVEVVGELGQAVSPVVRTEETDPRILFQGVWATSAVAARSAGAWRCTKTTGAVASIAFTGTEVRWIATKAPGYGIAYVSLDGGTPRSVDLYATDYSHQQIVWSKEGLAAGPHTVRIWCSGSARPQSSGTYVGIDAVEVVGELGQAQ